MGNSFETLAFTGSGIGTAFAAVTGVGSDSGTMRNFRPNTPGFIYGVWAQALTPGAVRFRSPEMNDNTIGFEAFFSPPGTATGLTATGSASPIAVGLQQKTVTDFLGPDIPEPISPQQALTVQMANSGSDTSIGMGMLVYYQDQPGLQQSLIGRDQLHRQFVKNATLPITTLSGLQYSTTSTAINATNAGTLVNNTNYAVIGYTTVYDVLSINLKGPCTSNIHFGGPGTSILPLRTASYFLDLSDNLGLPAIPVFNSADASGTFVEIANSAGGAFPIQVSLHLAQLRGQI